MSNCSINTECRCDSLVSAIRDVLEARDDDVGFRFAPAIGQDVFASQYPCLSDALDRAAQLLTTFEETSDA